MLTKNDTHLIEINHLTVRVKPPEITDNTKLLVLLHGWTGDENVMWVFVRQIPKDYWILAPRAPFPTAEGGYSWTTSNSGIHAGIAEYRQAVETLRQLVDAWQPTVPVERNTFSLMGFSQGAALSYSFAFMHPDRIQRLVGLAGFIPAGVEDLIANQPLSNKRIFVAHGTRDERIPIDRAHQTVGILERAGAKVDFCEANVGHKLSANCLRGVEAFLR